MSCTRHDFELVMSAIRSSISDGRQIGNVCDGSQDEVTAQQLAEACSRISETSSPALLQAIGNYTLLCLVRADIAALRAQAEIRKLMDL